MSDYLWKIVRRLNDTGDLQQARSNRFNRFRVEPDAEVRELTENRNAEPGDICAPGEDSPLNKTAIVRERAAVSGAEQTEDMGNSLPQKSQEPSFCSSPESKPESKESQRKIHLEETLPEKRSLRTAPASEYSNNTLAHQQTNVDSLVQKKPQAVSGHIEDVKAAAPSNNDQNNAINESKRTRLDDAVMTAQSVPVLVPARVQSVACTPPSIKPTTTPSNKLIIGQMHVEVVSVAATTKQEGGRSGNSRSGKKEPERNTQAFSRSPLRFGLGQM